MPRVTASKLEKQVKRSTAAPATYRRSFKSAGHTEVLHRSAIDAPTARQQRIVDAFATAPPIGSHAPRTADSAGAESVASAPRKLVILESKNVTSFSSYFAGLASRAADITCI